MELKFTTKKEYFDAIEKHGNYGIYAKVTLVELALILSRLESGEVLPNPLTKEIVKAMNTEPNDDENEESFQNNQGGNIADLEIIAARFAEKNEKNYRSAAEFLKVAITLIRNEANNA